MKINYPLAVVFTEEVLARLTTDEIKVVNERNATEAYNDCCATHDFCDANMLMHAAFKKVFKREINLQGKSDTEVWNNAWSYAKENKFDLNLMAQNLLPENIQKELGSLKTFQTAIRKFKEES